MPFDLTDNNKIGDAMRYDDTKTIVDTVANFIILK